MKDSYVDTHPGGTLIDVRDSKTGQILSSCLFSRTGQWYVKDWDYTKPPGARITACYVLEKRGMVNV